MNNEEEPGYAEPQRQVQRWLGRCLLSLQQSERMLKALLVDSQLSVRIPVAAYGPPHVSRGYEQEKVAGMTLGGLVSLFCGDVVVAEPKAKTEDASEEPSNQLAFDMRFTINLDQAEHVTLAASMKEMVQLRNDLVHHLTERFKLTCLDGCTDALNFLQCSYERIENFRKQLNVFGEQMLASRQHFQELLATKPFQNFLTTGKVPLLGTSMVDAMQAAFDECGGQESGFVLLDVYTTWLEQHRPEESYETYGRVSWAQLIHESDLYRIRRTDESGNKMAARVIPVSRQDAARSLSP